MRFFRRKPRKIVAVCDVYNEPGMEAVLYAGASRYVYRERSR